MPDDELLAAAQRGPLAANLEAQVHRMLRDEKAQALVENFALQWLQVRNLYGRPIPACFLSSMKNCARPWRKRLNYSVAALSGKTEACSSFLMRIIHS